jgi:8-amino-7-oxononanoate synthase
MPPPPARQRPAATTTTTTTTVPAATVDLVDRPAPSGWLARWLAACADLQDLFAHHQLLDAVIDEVRGRRIRVGGRWLVDFASCNYLGLDLDPEVIAAIPGYLQRWGTHPSWSRMLGSPALYQQIEARLVALLGTEDALLLPTLTHIHAAVVPILASDGTIFVDSRAHKTIWDGAVIARAHGASLHRFPHHDPEALERLLRRHPRPPRLVCMDGVNSMTGNPPDLAAFAALARAYDALLYLDDAHGFGVVGQRSRDEPCPYGRRGNGVVRHLGETYDHVILTGGFSKAYSSLLAFIACPSALKRLLKVAAPPYLYSGPSPIASLASALVGLEINDARGDELRALLYARTRRVLDHLDKLGAATLNTSGFPIIEVPLADPQDLPRAGRFLLDHGIYATLAFYPGVPRQEVGFRLQLTAATTDQQVAQLLTVLDLLADTIPLRLRRP